MHGQYFDRIILDDDPDYYWQGRISIQGNYSPKDYNMITMDYNLDPYKRLVLSNEVNWWRWNSLFTNNITFGPFQVNGTKARNFVNSSPNKITAQLNCSVAMRMYPYDGKERVMFSMYSLNYYKDNGLYPYVDLYPGYNEIVLEPGDNHYMFYGFGNVSLEYERGKFL